MLGKALSPRLYLLYIKPALPFWGGCMGVGPWGYFENQGGRERKKRNLVGLCGPKPWVRVVRKWVVDLVHRPIGELSSQPLAWSPHYNCTQTPHLDGLMAKVNPRNYPEFLAINQGSTSTNYCSTMASLITSYIIIFRNVEISYKFLFSKKRILWIENR